jgi:hypothetical protein
MKHRSRRARVALVAVTALTLGGSSAMAEDEAPAPAPEAAPEAPPAPAVSGERGFGDKLRSLTVVVGLDSAAPLRFTDTPDMRLDSTRVFGYGGHLGVMLGDELVDAHRVGLVVGYATVARSAERSLALVTPRLVYETGHPVMLQVGLGWAIPTGTAGFADQYGGLLSTAALQYSFRRAQPRSRLSATLGVVGQVIAATKDFDKSSVFVGAQLDLGVRLGGKGDQ